MSGKVHATILKGIAGGFEFSFFQRNLKDLARKAMEICLRVLEESNKSRFDSYSRLDCEQSLVFFRFSESNARARERRSRETRETRAAAREKKRETARLARANELSVGLTTQNTIG